MTVRTDITAHRGFSLGRTEEELDSLWPALDRIIEHVRELVRCDMAAFQIVDLPRQQMEPVASWFATPDLRAAFEPLLSRPYDRARPGLTEAALERGRPLLLPRLEDWEAAPRMLAAARDAMGVEEANEAWQLYRRASVISCPVQASLGRTLGVLVIASVTSDHTLTRDELRMVAGPRRPRVAGARALGAAAGRGEARA